MTLPTADDLILGPVGHRALDGISPCRPQFGLSTAAWALFVALLPYANGSAGVCALTGAALTAWNAATDDARSGLSRFLANGGASLAFPYGIQEFGSRQNPTYLNLAFSSATVDGALLYTVPLSSVLHVYRLDWRVTAPFAGGMTPAIGLSSDAGGFNGKGDLLGGASGDGVALLGAITAGGTRTAKLPLDGDVSLQAGESLRFDRIASAFTSGEGVVIVTCALWQ